jgi:hypothetical protein
MSATTAWSIASLNVSGNPDKPAGHTSGAWWVCTAQENGKKAWIGGLVDLDGESDPFIDYQDLSEQTVLGWVWQRVDREGIEGATIERLRAIHAQAAPQLPWSP